MKKIASTLLAFVSLSSFAHAEVNMISCDSIRGTDNALTLVVFNQDLKQVRVQTNGSHARALIPNKILNQNIKGITLYTVNGLPGFMEVENRVLAGEGGNVRLSNDEFSCL